ncbi:MAG: flagellar hook-length control protein FliK [Gammaproteobacteria bacterium]
MDIKGLTGPSRDNPPTLGRVDPSVIHPTLAASGAKPVGEQAFSRVWQVGAILQLMVAQVQGKTVSLTLPNVTGDAPLLQTRTPLPLVAGQQVIARVTGDLKNPSLQLLQINQSPQDILSQTLRQQLPQQQALPPVLANLHWAARQPATATGVLSPQVLDIARTFMANLPSQQQLHDPNQLFKALHLSGQYLEHSLHNRATGQPHFNPEQDVRAQLLRLAQALRQQVNTPPGTERSAPAPATPTAEAAPTRTGGEAVPQHRHDPLPTTAAPLASRTQTAQPQAPSTASLAGGADPKLMAEDFLRQVDGALARLQTQQLQALQTEQQGRPVWMMEVPVKTEHGIDLFDLRIQRDGAQQEQTQGDEAEPQEPPWSMTLAFDLEGLGPIRVKVSLLGDAITANFWAELPDTRRLFHEHIEHLRARLNQNGLDVNELSCQCGIPPEPAVYLESRLLDERA